MRPVFPAPALSVLRDTQPPVSSTREVLADRYEVLALLGCGGMGCVYRVRDRALDEVVALKMLRKELVTDASIVERFRQEVKLARRVTHENIARVFDIGECRGEKFLTMEYVEGPCLAELVTAGEIIVPRRAIAIARAVASGLAAAHKVGVIHRDLKPENILLGHDGRIVVADFGIARLLESRGGMAHTSDSPVGTPAYMAPEQVEGAADVDARADTYALGVVLFEMLAGRLPFDGATPTAMAMQRLLRDPPHLRTVRPDLPGALSDLVFRAMARSRSDRTASADELEAGLHAIAHMVPEAAPTMPAGFSSRLSLYDVSESMGTDRRVDDVARDLSRVVIGQALESNPVSAPTVAALETFEERRAPAPAPASSHSMKAAHRRATDLAKSVAILPFKNLGPADEEYLSDGLTDDLIDSLSVVSDLRVRPRGMVTRFGRSDLDLREVGRELDVQAIVEGSVRALGGKVRVSARVVGVHDGFQLWAKRFERPAAEFLVLGDELAQAIASALTVRHEGRDRRAPTDPGAIDLYLRGRHEHSKFWREGNARAVDFMREAHERAPSDPTIMAGYAMALTRSFAIGDDARAAGDLARSLAQRALAQEPELAEAEVALAGLHLNTGNLVGAATSVARALKLAPTSADAQDICGSMLIEMGALHEGILRLQTAVALEPRLSYTSWRRARAYALLGDWERCDAIFADMPSDADAKNLYWLSRMRIALWRNEQDAVDAFRKNIGDDTFFFLGISHAMCDLLETGVVPARAFDSISGWTKGATVRRLAFLDQLRAEMLAYAGDVRGALRAVGDAEAHGLFDLAWIDSCPLLEPLRAMPVYRALRTRIETRILPAKQALAVAGG